MAQDPLKPFDPALVAAVAIETGIDESRLRSLIVRHQEAVHDSPGVDDLVYEWRKYGAYDPLVERTNDAYHLALREPVWEEFVAALDLTATEREALLAVHARQARTDAAERGEDPQFEGACPMILTR